METKSFSLWLYMSTTNKYKATEGAWLQKALVPYQIIHSSLLLQAAFCCCFSFCFISTREWAQVGRKQMSPVSPPSIPLESQGCLPKWTRKKQSLLLHLQICCVDLCNILNSSVSKILCLQNGAKKCCPLESIFKTSYEKCLVVCLIFTSAAVLLNLFLPGESVLYKVR